MHTFHPERIEHDGDLLERYFATRILQIIPSYATIWATYIGNDGNAQTLLMAKSSRAAEQNRAQFWECAYTLFESLALCWKLEEEFNHKEKSKNVDDYISNLNAWVVFYAHLGRIYDMAKDSDQLNGKVSANPIKEFFDRRCIVLHGPKVPMRWLDNVLLAPPLGERPGQWHDKMHWDDLTAEQFNFVTSQVSETLRELEPLLNNFLGQSLGLVESQLGLSPVSWPSRERSSFAQSEIETTTSSGGANVLLPSGTQPYSSSGQDISGMHGSSQTDSDY